MLLTVYLCEKIDCETPPPRRFQTSVDTQIVQRPSEILEAQVVAQSCDPYSHDGGSERHVNDADTVFSA